MKRIIFFAAIATSLLYGCRTYMISSSSIDYKNYTDKGFFITESNSVNFEYDPVASVSSFINSGYPRNKDISKGSNWTRDEMYGTTPKKEKSNKVKRTGNNASRNDFKFATAEDALHELYLRAIETGANGIINLKIMPIYSGKIGSVLVYNYTASGMAIKRR